MLKLKYCSRTGRYRGQEIVVWRCAGVDAGVPLLLVVVAHSNAAGTPTYDGRSWGSELGWATHRIFVAQYCELQY